MTAAHVILWQPRCLRPIRRRRLSRSNRAGFTFIELFVVMAIIGILAGAVVLHSIGADQEQNLKTEAKRLAALIELARDEALSRNESWGLLVGETQYAFRVYDELEGIWKAPAKHAFRTRNAPPGMTFSLQVEGLLQLDAWSDPFAGQPERAATDGAGEERVDLPQVLILASGEQTPFQIGVGTAERDAWSVNSDGISRTRASPTVASGDRT